MRIRRAIADDAPLLSTIALRSKAHWGYTPAQMREWELRLSIDALTIVRHPTWCAVERGTILGFYQLIERPAGLFLDHLWVDPAHLRRGIGRTLLSHARQQVPVNLLIESEPKAEGFYLAEGARLLERIHAPIAGQPDRTYPLMKMPYYSD